MTLVFHYDGRVEKGFQLSISNAFFNQYITPAMFCMHKADLKDPTELMSWVFMNKIMPIVLRSKTDRLRRVKATYDNTGGSEMRALSPTAPVIPHGILDKFHSSLVASRAVFPPAELQDMINKAVAFCSTPANRGSTVQSTLPYPPISNRTLPSTPVSPSKLSQNIRLPRTPSKMASQTIVSPSSSRQPSVGLSHLDSSSPCNERSSSRQRPDTLFSTPTRRQPLHRSTPTPTNSSVISSGSRIHVLPAFPSTMQPSCMFPSLMYPLNSNPSASREIIKETGESVGGFTGLWVDAFRAVLPPHINLHIRKTLNGSINESSWELQFHAFHTLFADSPDGSSSLISSLLHALKIDYSNYKIVLAYERSLSSLDDDEAEDDESDGVEVV